MKPSRYGPFPNTPITKRPKLTWPNDARIAVWVVPNIEFFGLDDTFPGDPILRSQPRVPNVRDWSIREWGNRVGVWNLMEVMVKHGVPGTVSLNSEICDYHPQIVEEVVKLGWEFMGHCRNNLQRLNEVEPEREREIIHEVLTRIAKATGKKPVGWLGAGLSETWNTPDYLIEEGCTYVADWFCDDQPFVMNIEGKRLVSIPYSFETNDWNAFLANKCSTDEFESIMKRQFDVLYRQGERSGRVMGICLHPFITGQPARSKPFDAALKYICSHDGVWKATGEEIMNAYLQSKAAV